MQSGTKEYKQFHHLMRETKGHASHYKCHDCDSKACDWSWIHDTDEWDISNYVPRCRSCHLLYDYTEKRCEAIRQSMLGNTRTLGRKRPEQERAKLVGNTNASGQRTQEARNRMAQAKIGKRGNNCKFSQQQEQEIAALYWAGNIPVAELAKTYGIHRASVRKLAYRYVEPD